MTPPPRPSSFRTRLTLRWALTVALLLGAADFVVYAGARTYVYRWFDGNLLTLAATEAASSTDGPEGVHLHESSFAQLSSGAFVEKYVQIYDARGQLVLQSTALKDRPPLVDAASVQSGIAGSAPVLSVRIEPHRVRIAVLRAERGGRTYAVAVGLVADDIDAGLTSLASLLALVWLASVAGTAALGFRLASRALDPVARITERAAWIAQGNFDARLDLPRHHDELGRMTMLLNSMLDRLQRAVEANRRFAADASHELRGPLTAMAGEIDVTLRHPRSTDEYRETLERVRGRLGALTRLAEDLILLARTQEGAREITLREVALVTLVDETFQRLRDVAAGRGVTLTHRGLAGIHVYADPILIARVIDNLVANAVQYNRDHGTVEITASVSDPPGHAWVAPSVGIRVTDTGRGIPAEARERVFERFVRLDESRTWRTGGSGLGLAICREVLALHNGTVVVAESSETGTTIEVVLPGGHAERAYTESVSVR